MRGTAKIRTLLTLTAMTLASVLAGCSSGEDGEGGKGGEGSKGAQPIEIVSKPSEVGDPISLDQPLHDSGMFEPEKWPSACELTDEKTVSGILPQAEQVSAQPQERQVQLLTMGFGGDDDGGDDTVTIPEADCTAGVTFPEDMGLGDDAVTFTFTSSIEAAGSKKFVEENMGDPIGEKEKIGDATCWKDPSGLLYECRLDEIAFTMSLDARPYGQYLHESESAYVVDGEDVTFSNDMEAFNKMADEKVLRPTLESAIERLG